MKKFVCGLGVLVAALAIIAPAHALTVTSSLGLLPPGGSYGNLATFDDLTAQTFGSSTTSGAFTDGGLSFSTGGIIMNNPTQGSDGLYAEPAGDTSNYLAVLGGSSVTVSLLPGTYATELGLYWGSIDAYNTIIFTVNGTPVATVTGSQAATPANGDQSSPITNTYITVAGLDFNGFILESSQNSFEMDNLSYDLNRGNLSLAPIPGSVYLFAGGLGLLGMISLRGKRKPSAALAA
jgi:hypothetical protein